MEFGLALALAVDCVEVVLRHSCVCLADFRLRVAPAFVEERIEVLIFATRTERRLPVDDALIEDRVPDLL